MNILLPKVLLYLLTLAPFIGFLSLTFVDMAIMNIISAFIKFLFILIFLNNTVQKKWNNLPKYFYFFLKFLTDLSLTLNEQIKKSLWKKPGYLSNLPQFFTIFHQFLKKLPSILDRGRSSFP